jgi:hypothetical protein
LHVVVQQVAHRAQHGLVVAIQQASAA